MTKAEKIRFGVVGTNTISDKVLKGAFEDPRFELTAVCSRSLEKGLQFAEKYGVSKVFDSLEAMAASDDIDAVYIATPNYIHAQQAILCMNYGKHVLCEKPLASNAREVKAMIDASKRNRATLMEAMKTTLTPNFLRVRDRLHRVGPLRRYFGCYCQYSSRYDKLRFEGVVLNAFKKEFSNGAVMDLGIYTIYPMVVLFGTPESVAANALLLPTGVDGQGSAIMSFKEMCGDVMYSKICDSLLPSEIQGEDGIISISDIHDFTDVCYTDRRTKEKEVWSVNTQKGHDSYYWEVAEFIDTILSGALESRINSHANSLTVMEIIDEIRRQTGVVYPADTPR